MAIINDKFVRLGEEIEKFRVVRISSNEVVLRAGELQRIIQVMIARKTPGAIAVCYMGNELMDWKNQPIAVIARRIKQMAWVLLVFVVVQLAGGSSQSAEVADGLTSTLETVRAGRHDSYTSVVFQFNGPFAFDAPRRIGDEIRFNIPNTQTQLVAYREYHISAGMDSAGTLEQRCRGARGSFGCI